MDFLGVWVWDNNTYTRACLLMLDIVRYLEFPFLFNFPHGILKEDLKSFCPNHIVRSFVNGNWFGQTICILQVPRPSGSVALLEILLHRVGVGAHLGSSQDSSQNRFQASFAVLCMMRNERMSATLGIEHFSMNACIVLD